MRAFKRHVTTKHLIMHLRFSVLLGLHSVHKHLKEIYWITEDVIVEIAVIPNSPQQCDGITAKLNP